MLTVSKLMDILKDFPEDAPVLLVKDAMDHRHDGCYYVTEVAKLHSKYANPSDAIGLSISNEGIILLTTNFDSTIWRKEKEND